MTALDLEDVILGSGDVRAVADAFAGLDEKERKKFSTAARQIHSQLSNNKANDTASPRLKAFIAGRVGEPWALHGTIEARKAALTLFAVGPLSSLRANAILVAYYDFGEVEKIITDRKPDWLDDWIHHEFEKRFNALQFPTLRSWIRAGLCRKPDHDRYYEMFAGYLMRTSEMDGKDRPPAPPISQQLLADPELLEDVWALFRAETIAFNTNSWLVVGASSAYETWPQALAKLSQTGDLDRGRLLDASLDGLTQDVKQNQLSGIHKFHRQLEPTPDEMRARQTAYLALLCHRVGHVARFAIDMAGKLHQLGLLDAEEFLREVPSVFLQPTKGNAIAALKLTDRLLKRNPKLLSQALSSIKEALRSDSGEVQALTLDLVEAHSRDLSSEQIAELASLSDFITPAIRARFNAVLRLDMPPSNCALEDGAAEIDIDKPYTPISEVFGQLPILPTVAPLAPIESLDELISAVSHAVEHVDSADEIERIIDGVSRFCDQRPPDFDSRVAPLLHRIEKGGGTSYRGLMLGGNEATCAVVDLVMTWLTGRISSRESITSATDAFVPMHAMLRAVTQRAAAKRNQQLLSAPTHQNGWIDPQIWITRLIDADQKKIELEPLDLSYSLLRLMPDHRPEALARCNELSGWLRRVVSFALGGEERPKPEDRSRYAIWITAARARDPAADWRETFAPLALRDFWPDSLSQAAYSWRAFIQVNRAYNGYEWKEPKFEIDRGQPVNELVAASNVNWRDIPTAALNHTSKGDQRWTYDWMSIWASQWLAHLWPQNAASAFATAAGKLANRMDDDSSTFEPSVGFLNCLFQKNRPWAEMGHVALLLALAGKDADTRGLGVDALVEGIESGQFDPDLFGAALAKFAQGGGMKPGRVALAMQQAARVSPLHAWAAGETIQCALPGLDLRAPNMFAIVELLLECQLTVRHPINAAAAATLGSVDGAGKIAKAARQLLQLSVRDDSMLREVRSLALKGRSALLQEGASLLRVTG